MKKMSTGSKGKIYVLVNAHAFVILQTIGAPLYNFEMF